MLDRAKHLSALGLALDDLRGAVFPTNSLSIIVTLYGLKVLFECAEHYERLGIDADLNLGWGDLLRSQEPAALLMRCVEFLAHNPRLTPFRHPPFSAAYLEQRVGEDRLSRVILTLDRLNVDVKTLVDLRDVGEVLESFLARPLTADRSRGEHYTPPELNTLKARLLLSDDANTPEEVYDPTCGVGGNLVALHKLLPPSALPRAEYFGQDVDAAALYLCAWNLLLHGITRFQLAEGDTLTEPRLKDPATGEIKRFDLVVADPPFGVKANITLSGEDPYRRFRYGEVRGSRTEYAFLQHILASLKEGGRAAVSLLSGALFRSGFEQTIRENFVRAGVVSASVALPSNLLPNTNLPVNILIFNFNETRGAREQVLFVDASEMTSYDRTPSLSASRQDAIVKAVAERSNAAGSVLADLGVLEAHAYSLLPQVYLPRSAQKLPSAGDLDDEITELEDELAEARDKFDRALEALTASTLRGGETR